MLAPVPVCLEGRQRWLPLWWGWGYRNCQSGQGWRDDSGRHLASCILFPLIIYYNLAFHSVYHSFINKFLVLGFIFLKLNTYLFTTSSLLPIYTQYLHPSLLRYHPPLSLNAIQDFTSCIPQD